MNEDCGEGRMLWEMLRQIREWLEGEGDSSLTSVYQFFTLSVRYVGRASLLRAGDNPGLLLRLFEHLVGVARPSSRAGAPSRYRRFRREPFRRFGFLPSLAKPTAQAAACETLVIRAQAPNADGHHGRRS